MISEPLVDTVLGFDIFGLARRSKIIGLSTVILQDLYFVEVLRNLSTERNFN